MTSGILYVLGSPIGNLGDITIRALETLKNVDFIVSEDTRETNKLLSHFNISKQQISYRDQNHDYVKDRIFDLLKNGNNLALVSDSGTPLISDPGFKLIDEALRGGFNVVSVPGPSALTASLSISGLPTDKVVFLGFLSKKEKQRKDVLVEYGKLHATLVIFESPNRFYKLLAELLDTLGDRVVCISREMTKIHEQVVTNRLSVLLNSKELIKEKGEFVILVAKEDFKW